jgi:hypothetical protein
VGKEKNSFGIFLLEKKGGQFQWEIEMFAEIKNNPTIERELCKCIL